MEDESFRQVIVIGTGPAGLAAAAQLQRRNISFTILEKGPNIAQSWQQHYDRLHLHTVKEFSHLPDTPFPDDYPMYVPKKELIAYYEAFAKKHGIEPEFEQEVIGIQKVDNHWQVSSQSGFVYKSQAVVLCTGMNRVPFRPHYQYEEDFVGSLVHSNDYQHPEPYKGQRVLVVGMGNSGAEIALDLCEKGVDTAISVRGPVNIVPREIFGRPTQITALKLAKLPNWLSDRLGLIVRKFTVSDLPKYGITLPALAPTQQLRETGQTPVIDLGTLDYIRSGVLKVYPAIDQFSSHGVLFSDGEEQAFDAVIFATGFRANLQDWLPLDSDFFDQKDLPKGNVGKGQLDGLYFLGFNNYAPGGGLGIIRKEVVEMADHLEKRLAK